MAAFDQRSIQHVIGRGADESAGPRYARGVAAGRTADPVDTGILALLEVCASGHRLHYIDHLMSAYGADRCTVLTSATALEEEEYVLFAKRLGGCTVVLPSAGPHVNVLAAAVDAALDRGATRLIVPDGDKYLVPLLRLLVLRPRLPLRIRLLIMRTTSVFGPERLRAATLAKPVLAQLVRRFPQVGLFFLTDALGVVQRRPGFQGVQPLKDPVLRGELSHCARPEWFPPAADGRIVIGLFGTLTARKNIPLLLDAIADVPEAVLVLAGRYEDDDTQRLMASQRVAELVAEGRVVARRGLLPADELGAALANVDLVALLYDNDAPSGILAEACIRGTPALVPAGGWLAKVVESTSIGLTTRLETAAVADGIRRMAARLPELEESTRRQAPRIGTHDFTARLLDL